AATKKNLPPTNHGKLTGYSRTIDPMRPAAGSPRPARLRQHGLKQQHRHWSACRRASAYNFPDLAFQGPTDGRTDDSRRRNAEYFADLLQPYLSTIELRRELQLSQKAQSSFFPSSPTELKSKLDLGSEGRAASRCA